MDDAQKRKIDALFDAALDLPAAKREAFLEAECESAAERQAVSRLLHTGDSTVSLLDDAGPWQGQLGQQMAQTMVLDAAREGDRIGAYEVIRELGRGGMASVYLATRADGHFEQQVALKLAAPTVYNQEELLRRFHLERQILASLDHPNIARLVDGGLTPNGRPYFAMELIKGAPIDRYCDDKCLPVEARLRLMIDVARGVEAAHRALIVHRDLKPSNVMVTEDGVVKLLDFGIAKQVSKEGDLLGMTQTSGGMMTPEYASPEQYRAALVTTSSDVYQLGLLLYQLLIGDRPFRLAGLSPAEAQEMICEVPPERPSTKLKRATDRDVTEQIGSRRRIKPRELQRLLSGDLDTLVMKALRKEPERRYRSAAEFADDLENYLDGRPIRARGDSPLYLAKKFFERHRVVMTATAVAMMVLIGVVTFYTYRLGIERNAARLEAKRASEARDDALVATADAEKTAQFLTELFQQSDPWEMDGQALTARDLLDRGALKVRRELADQPVTQARMMDTIGNVYRRLGLYGEAETLLEEGLALRGQHLPPDHPDLGKSLYHLAYLQHNRSEFQRADENFRRALEISEPHHGPQSKQVAKTLTGLANNQHDLGQLDEAKRLFERVLSIEVALYGAQHEEVAATLANLAMVHFDQGHFREAIARFETVIALEEKLLGPDHLRLANSLNNLGIVFERQGDADKATQLYEQSLKIKIEQLGEDHVLVASSLINLATIYRKTQRPEDSERSLLRAIQMLEHKAPKHTHLGNAYTNLAALYLEREDFERAEENFKLAFNNRLAALGPEHPDIGAAHYNFGELYQLLGRAQESETSFRQALAIWQKALSPSHLYLGVGLATVAELDLEKGDLEPAEEQFARAYEILTTQVNPSHEMRQRAVAGYADLLTRTGRTSEAEAVRASLAAPRDQDSP